MATITTPEKVKSLLSTFLASAKQQSTLKTVATTSSGSPEKSSSASQDVPSGHTIMTTPSKSTGSTNSLRTYDSFLERLDTFTSLTWFGKPAEVSPMICARYGWANIDKDSLQCVGCKAHLCGNLPDRNDHKAYKVFKEKLKKDILAAHDKFCVLAANPCPESFCLIPCDDPTSLTSGFCQRVTSLESVSVSLPNLDYSTLHSLKYDEGQGAAYCKRLLLPESDTSATVVALAVTGWSTIPSKSDILMCSRCRRHVGLWNFDKQSGHAVFNSKEKDSLAEHNNGDQEPEAKLPKIVVKSSFNPVEQHKHWCPWMVPTLSSSSPSSSSNTSSSSLTPPAGGGKRAREEEAFLPAFIVALKSMAPGLMDNNTGLAQAMKVSPVADGLKCFRRVMKAWSSPKLVSDSPSPSPSPLSSSSSLLSTPWSTKASS